ncbi:hypothetical protein [Gaiella sp.]|uniref:hypothetical protein n=1 Tax=Gaiella sp. TaxID=2663207 RepID=UPI002E300BAD|nr:hypothetical protein [Gaiella sp.]HEX5582520.1 hypothetical protein [Gaiella sp.]
MNASDKIALASVGATVVVAIAGYALNVWTQKSERKHREDEAAAERTHALQLSRADRYFAARLDAYREAARMLERVRLFVQRRNPLLVIGDPQPMPPNFDDAEWETLRGRIVVASSPEALDAIDVASRAYNDFQAHAMTYEELRAQNAATGLGESGKQMEEARTAAYAAIDNAQQVMREELGSL